MEGIVAMETGLPEFEIVRDEFAAFGASVGVLAMFLSKPKGADEREEEPQG